VVVWAVFLLLLIAQSSLLSPAYAHDAMGDDASGGAIEDNVRNSDIRWRDRLHGDDFSLPDRGMHAPAVGAESDAAPKAQEVFA